MAILFFDDFRGYSLANITQAWTSEFGVTANWTIATSGGRSSSTGYLQTDSSNVARYLVQTFAAQSSLVVGFAFMVTTTSVVTSVVAFADAGTVQVALRLNADGTFSITRGTTALTDGTSVNAVALNTWYYVEFKSTIANSIGAGTTTLTVNGVTWVTVATGQDTQATSNSTANSIQLGKISSTVTTQYRFADLYIASGTTLLGDCTVDTLYVNGNGTTQDFDPSSGSDHSLLVDDTSGDGDTDYVSTTVATERELFTMGNLSVTPNTIHAVSVWNSVRKDDAGVKKFESTVRSGGTNYDGAEASALDSYRYDMPIWETDPATASAWSASGVNAIEAGIQVTV